jgi:hypothetical protein
LPLAVVVLVEQATAPGRTEQETLGLLVEIITKT